MASVDVLSRWALKSFMLTAPSITSMIKYQILMSYIVVIFFFLKINNGNNGGVICNLSVKASGRSEQTYSDVESRRNSSERERATNLRMLI